ncbi:unnamed protein product [Didymodactylos carnosus]|uniref:NACHT domain-containing protein n=1 Tax=Didymodactylos carnosus TaxID=1234261 RepID=A0A815MZH3_9BILA|nr:unnamed protein product [Didymodactylos carnosus]CAF4305091.1 unnamed protein product [Didymodactylos carnosus]
MLMTENDLGKYQTGTQIMTRTFLSTSKKLTVAEFFAGEGQQNSFRKTSDRTHIQISVVCQHKIKNTRTALDIESMSSILDEQEVLITPFATFNVTNVKRHDPTTNPSVSVEIELEEYESVCEPTYLCELIRHQHKRYSRIERLMNPAKSFPIEQSYINLAIVEIKEQQKKEKKLRNAQQSDAIIGIFEEIHGAKALVDVKDIFETCKNQTKKVLVLGRAGIGKTTFCRYVAYRWANGTIWPQYKPIFLIPPRRLTESRYPPLSSGISYSRIDLVEKECFHHALSDKDKIYLREPFDKSQVLWLLDGYDEIVQNVPAHLQYLFEQLLNTPHHILTSRPYSNKLSYDVIMEITGFTDDNIHEYSACEALGKLGEKAATSEVIRALLNALGDENDAVRSSACEALGNMGDKAATSEVIRALLNALCDAQNLVRYSAREALETMGDEAATSELIRALLNALGDENENVRYSACVVLGKMGDKAATSELIRALLNALGDENANVRYSACEALEKMGDKAATSEVIRALLNALGDENANVRYSACVVLGKMGDKAATSEVIRALLNALGDENENVRYSACKALEKMGDKAATSELIRALLNALGDENEDVRYSACKVLEELISGFFHTENVDWLPVITIAALLQGSAVTGTAKTIVVYGSEDPAVVNALSLNHGRLTLKLVEAFVDQAKRLGLSRELPISFVMWNAVES